MVEHESANVWIQLAGVSALRGLSLLQLRSGMPTCISCTNSARSID